MEQTRDFQDLLVNFPKPFCVLVQHLPKNRILKTIYFVEILSEKSHPKGIYFVEILSDSSAPVGIIHRKTSSETFVNPTSIGGMVRCCHWYSNPGVTSFTTITVSPLANFDVFLTFLLLYAISANAYSIELIDSYYHHILGHKYNDVVVSCITT
jgi:hypothetical protein